LRYGRGDASIVEISGNGELGHRALMKRVEESENSKVHHRKLKVVKGALLIGSFKGLFTITKAEPGAEMRDDAMFSGGSKLTFSNKGGNI